MLARLLVSGHLSIGEQSYLASEMNIVTHIVLGIDSLVAVEVRSWFLEELNVDVPVLKIIGGDSITELCTKALSRFQCKGIWQGPEIEPVTQLAGAKDAPSSTLAAPQEPTRPASARDTDAGKFRLVSVLSVQT